MSNADLISLLRQYGGANAAEAPRGYQFACSLMLNAATEMQRLNARLAETERWLRYWMPDPNALHAYYRKPYADTQAFLGEADSRSEGR